MKKMEQFVDEFGCIAQGPYVSGAGKGKRDGGDGGHRMGAYATGINIRYKLKMSIKEWWAPNEGTMGWVKRHLQNSKGQFRRHPDPEGWYSQWNNASRDLTIALLCGCAMAGGTSIARKYIWSHFRSWGYIERIGHKKLPWGLKIPYWLPMLVAGNPLRNWTWRNGPVKEGEEWKVLYKIPDPTLFEVWALEIRAAKFWFLYPLLLVFDLENFIGSIVWNKWRDDDVDVINHVYSTSVGKYVYPTPLSLWSHKILNWQRAEDKFKRYFTAHPEDITEMYDLWQPIFEYNKDK